MDETKTEIINTLFDKLLTRVLFDIEHQPPQMLPPIAEVVMNLYAFKEGIQNGAEKQRVELTLIKNINSQINGFPPAGPAKK